MNSPSIQVGKPTLKELILLALLAALMVGTQVAMSFLPNVHLVAMLVILAALLFGWRAMYAVFVFVVMEGLIYGFSIWTVSYLYTWPLLAAFAVFFRKNRSPLFWAAVAGIHGMTFGAQCSLPYFIAGGWTAGFSYWVAGIPFDLIHCVSNAAITGFLLLPLYRLCAKLLNRTSQGRAKRADVPPQDTRSSDEQNLSDAPSQR